MKYCITCVLIIITLTGFVQAAQYESDPIYYDDIRVTTMGGANTAVADDANLLFYNPAGLATLGQKELDIVGALHNPTLWKTRYQQIGQTRIGNVQTHIGANLLDDENMQDIEYLLNHGIISSSSNDHYTTYASNMDVLNHWMYEILNLNLFGVYELDSATETYYLSLEGEALTNFTESAQRILDEPYYASARAEVLSHVRHGFGFGIFTRVDALVTIEPGVFPLYYYPTISATFDTIIPMSFGFHLPNSRDWSFGVTAKVFSRLQIKADTVEEFYDAMLWFDQNSNELNNLKNINMSDPNEIFNLQDYFNEVGSSDVVRAGYGLGFDLGVMYRISSAWRVGMVVRDVYTRIYWLDSGNDTDSILMPDFRFGVSWTPPIRLLPFISAPTLALDIDDLFFMNYQNIWLKFHAGVEWKFLWNMLFIRAGINQGYPTIGGGIDINLSLLSYLPIIKWLRPDDIYFPRFNPNRSDFWQRNPLFCLLDAVLWPILYLHVRAEVAYVTRYIGDDWNNVVFQVQDPVNGSWYDVNYNSELIVRIAVSFEY